MNNRRAKLAALIEAYAWAHYNEQEGTNPDREAKAEQARRELVDFIEARGFWSWVTFALGVALVLYAAAGGFAQVAGCGP